MMLVSRIRRRFLVPIVRMVSPPRSAICRLFSKSYPANFESVNMGMGQKTAGQNEDALRPGALSMVCKFTHEKAPSGEAPLGAKEALQTR